MLFIFCTISLEYHIFHSFIILSYTNQCVVTRNAFVLFPLVSGLVGIIVLFSLLACSPSIIWALIIFIILRPLFRIKQIRLGTVLRSFFVDQFEFSKSIGEVTTYLLKISESIGEFAVDKSKYIFDDSPVNIEAVDYTLYQQKEAEQLFDVVLLQ